MPAGCTDVKFSKQNEYLYLQRRPGILPIFVTRNAIFPTLIFWQQLVAG